MSERRYAIGAELAASLRPRLRPEHSRPSPLVGYETEWPDMMRIVGFPDLPERPAGRLHRQVCSALRLLNFRRIHRANRSVWRDLCSRPSQRAGVFEWRGRVRPLGG